MNFSHLEYAMTVAECRSINKAAQRLLVSQPYLSGVLKNLRRNWAASYSNAATTESF